MKRWLVCVVIVLLVAALPSVRAEKKTSKQETKRSEINAMAAETLDKLFSESSSAKSLYESAYGYAVFSNFKLSLGLTGGGGSGVAVDKSSGGRTYMKMGTAGLNLGLGGQKYRVVFLFENKEVFTNFVEKGWKAEASANAVAGTAGANAEATFSDGMAFYQITEGGLMLQADISGTKYWKSGKLNQQ